MIAYIKGHILDRHTSSITLLTRSGVGYEIELTPARVSELRKSQEVSLYTYLRITDASHTLFGFFSLEEKRFFELLLSVSGVGPKSAMNILALGSIDEISDAIARKDVKYLTAVQGMGKKTAERLVVELKHKVQTANLVAEDTITGTVMSEVIDALVAMGYQKTEAVDTLKQLDIKDQKTEIVLRMALQALSK